MSTQHHPETASVPPGPFGAAGAAPTPPLAATPAAARRSSPVGFDARVRVALVRRDRDRLADAVGSLVARALAAPETMGTHAPAFRDQVLLARAVLLDIEHRLHGDEPVDPRGAEAVGALLHDVRLGRLAPYDLLALDDAARAARRLLVGRIAA